MLFEKVQVDLQISQPITRASDGGRTGIGGTASLHDFHESPPTARSPSTTGKRPRSNGDGEGRLLPLSLYNWPIMTGHCWNTWATARIACTYNQLTRSGSGDRAVLEPLDTWRNTVALSSIFPRRCRNFLIAVGLNSGINYSSIHHGLPLGNPSWDTLECL